MKRVLLVAAMMGLFAFGATVLVQAGDLHHGSASCGYSGYGNSGYREIYRGYEPNYPSGHLGYGQDGYSSGQSGHGSYHGNYGYSAHQSAGHGIQINAPHFGLRIGH